jgi:hypothetical protein
MILIEVTEHQQKNKFVFDTIQKNDYGKILKIKQSNIELTQFGCEII